MRKSIVGFLDGSDFIDPPGIKVVQSHSIGFKPGREIVATTDPDFSDTIITLVIPATRPSLCFPLTEEIAAKENIDLWYFDPKKWPDRIPVDPAEYLDIPRK